MTECSIKPELIHFNLLIQSISTVGLAIVDHKGMIINGNNKFFKLLGLDRECLNNIPINEIFPNQFNVLLEECNIGKEFDIKYKDKSGNEYFLRGATISTCNAKDEVPYFLLKITDVINREQLSNQQSLISEILEHVSCSLIVTDSIGDIKYVNSTFCYTTGYTFEEIIGQNPRILKSGVMNDNVYKELWETILSGKVWKGELINKKKNGDLYSELATIIPVKENNKITNFIGIKDNITLIKQQQNKLIETERLVEIGKMASYIMHEIKSPFASIKMNFESLKNNMSIKSTPFIIIERELKRLDKFLNEVLQFSREKELEIVNINLCKTFNISAEILEPILLKKQILIENKLPNIIIKADYQKIISVFIYLLENASDAISGNGKIEIWSELKDNNVIIYFKDNGCGIDSSIQNKIFNPFFTSKSKGSGLGLALIRKILDRHFGLIELLSSKKGESIFKITIPIEHEQTKNSYN